MYKPNSLDELKTITAQTGDALGMPIDPTDIADVLGKINLLTMLLGSSCYAVALAERLYNHRMAYECQRVNSKTLTATDKKTIVIGLARVEAYYVTLTERQNKAIIHAIDGLKVIVDGCDRQPM